MVAREWSYDLLSEDEQRLYRRLSVFAGGWTLAAAEAVAGSPGSGELGLDVLEGLGRLVDHSLVRQVEGAAGEDRFTMLETIREYGLAQLEAGGEAEEARERHALHFLSVVETAEQALLLGREQGTWLDRLEVEHDNLRAALGWGLAHDAPLALRLAAAAGRFWYARGHVAEGRDWTERALAAAGDEPSVPRVRALAWLGDFFLFQGDPVRASELAEASLAMARALGDTLGEIRALNDLGWISLQAGDPIRSRHTFEEAAGLARAIGDERWEHGTLANLSNTYHALGEFSKARAAAEKVLAWSRRTDDLMGVAMALTSLAEISRDDGDLAGAVGQNREALVLAHTHHDRLGAGITLRSIASLALLVPTASVPEYDRAARLFGAADAVREVAGAGYEGLESPSREPDLASLRATLGEPAFTAAWEAGRALSLDEAIAEALALADALARGAPAPPPDTA